MRILDEEDLDDVIFWIRHGGFPGEATDEDVAWARNLLRSNKRLKAVIMALGGRSMLWVGTDTEEAVRPPTDSGEFPRDSSGGYALGVSDGAILPGIPQSWRLLTFACPQGDSELLVARYPPEPPLCPNDGSAMLYRRDLA